jgi:KTSC domain
LIHILGATGQELARAGKNEQQPPAALRVPHTAMEMKRLSGGNLRAAGYDDKNRVLVVELASGTFQYAGVTAEMWRRFAGASSPWSFFRDNIDEEYPAKRIR